jgi:hypothetical protein
MKPATRFLFGGLTLVILFTFLAAAGVIWCLRQTAHTRELHQLTIAGLVETKLEAQQREALQLRAQLLANDPAFVDYVAQSLVPNPQAGGAVDSASITDQLEERRSGYDVAVVLDTQGKPISTSGLLAKSRTSIQRDPLVVQAIALLKPVSGTWLVDGHVFWVMVNPLLRSNTLQGVLISALRVTNAFPNAISDITGTDVVLVNEGTAVAPLASNGFNPQISDLITAKSGEILGASDDQVQATRAIDDQRAILARVIPLLISNGRAAWVVVEPFTATDQDVRGESAPLLLGIAVLGALAALLVILQWWRTWLPLQQMLDVVERAGSGDRHLMVRVTGSFIVRELRDHLNRLIQQHNI